MNDPTSNNVSYQRLILAKKQKAIFFPSLWLNNW